MTPKKILIVSRSFYPQISPRSFRTTELAKELARQGHAVEVITPRDPKLHDQFEREHGLVLKNLGIPKWKPLYVKQKEPFRFFSRLLKRIGDQFLFYPEIELLWLVKKSLLKESGHDMLISIAAPHSVHWGVAKALKKNPLIAKKWVADCGDPFMLAENSVYKRPFYFKRFEKNFCRRADIITVPVKDAAHGYYPEFRKKIKVIPQGFRFEEVRKPAPPNNEVPTFAYAGTLVPKRRNPKPLLDFLLEKKYSFRFFIYSKNHYLVKDYAKNHPDKVFLKNTVPRDELLWELGKTDFVINFENVGNTQAPSKLIDYAILGKPILSIKPGQLDKNAVEKFMKGNYSESLEVKNIEQYRIERVAKSFIKLA